MPETVIDVNAKISEFINGSAYKAFDDSQRIEIIRKIKESGQSAPLSTTSAEHPDRIMMGGFAGPIYDTRATRSALDASVDMIRPVAGEFVGDAAAALTSPAMTIPVVGATVPLLARTGGYSITDAMLQYLKTEKPESFSSALKEGAVQSISNRAIGGLIKMLGRGGKSLMNVDQPEIYNFKPTTSQAATALGANKLASGAKLLEDISLTAKQKALDRTAGEGFTQALALSKKIGFDRTVSGQFMFSVNPRKMLDKVEEYMPMGEGSLTPIKIIKPNVGGPRVHTYQNPQIIAGESQIVNEADSFNKLDAVIKDPKKLQATLTAGQENGVGENLKKSLQGYQFQKMFNDATNASLTAGPAKGNVARIDAQKLIEQWKDPYMQDSFKTLYNARQRADIDQFFKNVAYTQDKISTMPVAKKLLFMHGGIGMATGLFTGNVPAGAAASAITFVGAEGLGHLLTNPKTARLMVALAGGEPLGVSETYAAKMITNVLQGSTVAMINSDGSSTPVVVGRGRR